MSRICGGARRSRNAQAMRPECTGNVTGREGANKVTGKREAHDWCAGMRQEAENGEYGGRNEHI